MHEYSDDILNKLRSMSKSAASRFFGGLEEDDFFQDAWLAFHESRQQGKSIALSITRAEYAIRDAMRNWIADKNTYDVVIEDGDIGAQSLASLWYDAPKTQRTKLPRRLKRAMAQLTEQERRALYLGFMWNRTHAEIAQELRVSESRAGVIRHRAIAKLRKLCDIE